jgi:hypothetical protein
MLAGIEDLPRQLKSEINRDKNLYRRTPVNCYETLLTMLVELKGKQAEELQQIYASVATNAKL